MDGTGSQQIKQYLTFRLGEETFAVDVSEVREIIDDVSLTKIPQTPDYFSGVINLRGNVLPVINLRTKFGMPFTETTKDTCIVVMEAKIEGTPISLGALVDSVLEVFELEDKDVEPAPKLGSKLNTDFIKGIGKKDQKFLIILDINKVFSSDELLLLKQSNETNM
ncbi:MAG TPA: chemotaxis protein CheW [Ignavibacteriales bacterium]|nr:chemotaxis protein CheW [Ignavibacteriales bacterium]